jgi:hypothetical protein
LKTIFSELPLNVFIDITVYGFFLITNDNIYYIKDSLDDTGTNTVNICIEIGKLLINNYIYNLYKDYKYDYKSCIT